MENQTNSKSLTKKALNIFYYLFFVGIAVYALYYCFKDIRIEEFINQVKSANYLLIGISMVVGVLVFIVRALRWNILIRTLGHNPSTYNTYNSLLIGYMANLAVPRIGEIIRCAVLNKTNKIPVDSLFGTVVTERVIDLLTLFMAIILVFFLRMEFFIEFITDKVIPQWTNISTATLIIVAVVAIVAVVVLFFLAKRLLKLPSMSKIKGIVIGLLEGIKSIFRMKDKFSFISYTIIIWFCYWLTSYLVLEALPYTSALTPADGLFLMVLGSLGWVVPVPGGMGTFHALVAWGLAMYGISSSDGVVFATISHESQLIGTVLFGLIALVSVSFAKKKLNTNS